MSVLDANILMRAVSAREIRPLLAKYRSTVRFHAPLTAFQRAAEIFN
jgi:hypothetical protein